MVAELDISVPRNGDYFEEWRLSDIAGLPIDLTGHTIAMSAREIAGDGAVIATADLTIVEAAYGAFSVRWRGEDFDAIGEPTVPVAVAYDLKHTYPDGVRIVPVRGHLILVPECTA
jgi:hypothetical protein